MTVSIKTTTFTSGQQAKCPLSHKRAKRAQLFHGGEVLDEWFDCVQCDEVGMLGSYPASHSEAVRLYHEKRKPPAIPAVLEKGISSRPTVFVSKTRLALMRSGGRGTDKKCYQGHVGAHVASLMVESSAGKNMVSNWINCPTCVARGLREAIQLPDSVADAIANLKQAGKWDRPNIQELVKGAEIPA